MVKRIALSVLSLCLLACGPRPKPIPDAGMEEEDAGMELDAGRPRGDDLPNGWQMALELPMGAAPSTKLGVSVAAIPDQFGYPIIAALYEDPNGDLNYDDTRVVYTRWSGAAKAFEPMKTIEVVGGAPFVHPNRQISIAREPVTGRIAIAYVKPQDNVIRVAYSDDEGANFSLRTISSEGVVAPYSNPALGLNGSDMYLACLKGDTDIEYTRWTPSGVVVTSSSITVGGRSVSVAVDSAGNPGVAFFEAVNGNSADLVFWRPGGVLPRPIASADMLDLSTLPGADPSVTLIFDGTTPHLAYHLRKSAAADATELWYLKSTDDGANWAAPIAIPRNSSGADVHSTRYYQALAVEPSGRVSVAAPWSFTGTQTNCNGPKLSRATDGMNFSTCSPMGSPIQRGGDWINLWTHKPGKQTLVFHYDSRSNPSIKAGVIVWREP